MAYTEVSTLLEFAGTMMAGLAVAIAVYRFRLRIRDWGRRWVRADWTRRRSMWLLGFLISSYVVILATLSLLQHINFRTHNDLAIHAQLLWNTSHGRWFATTLLEDRPTNYLGHHFSPALLLLAPLYLLWPDAALLLILQTIILGLGVIPIYLYAQRQTRSQLAALGLSLAYLLFPALGYVNLFEFHEIVLSVPLLSFSVYFVLAKRYRLFLVFLFLSLLVKEEVAFVAVAFALYILLVQRQYRLGVIVLLLAVGWGYLTMGVVMPAIAGRAYFPTGRYGYLGNSFGEIVRSALFNPLLVLRHLFIPTKLQFVLHLLVPLGLLPLLGFDTLIMALPTMLYLLLSDYEGQYSIHYHYPAPVIPLLFMAGAAGIHRLVRWKGSSVTFAVSAFVLVTGVLSYLLQGAGPLARYFNQDGEYNLWPALASGYDALAMIPPDASVMTIEEFAPHLAARKEIYIENESYLPVEYVFQEYTARVAVPRYPAFVPEGRELVYPLYETIFDRDGYWVRQYKDSVPISNEVGIGFGDSLTLLAFQWRSQEGVLQPVLEPGGYLDLIVAWRAEGRLPERYVFFVHVLDQNWHRWAQVDQEVEKGVYPTNLWEPGMVVADHYRLEVPWGTPPGEYQVLIGVYSHATGQRLRPICTECQVRDSALVLGPAQVVKPASPPPPEAVSAQQPLDIRLNGELELVGYDLGTTSVQPGGTIPLILTWRTLSQVTGEYTVVPILGQADGALSVSLLEEPVGLLYPPDQWHVSDVVRDWHDLRLPPDIPTGDYELALRVAERGRTIGQASLGRVEISGRSHLFATPYIQHSQKAIVGDSVLWLGYAVSTEEVEPGGTLHLTLYWQALGEMQVSYTVFTHMLDAEQRIWGQMDGIPLGGEAPTTSWIPGEIIVDEYDLVVNPQAQPGSYRIEIGMYDASTGQRLPIRDSQGTSIGDRVLLQPTQVLASE